MKTQFIFFLSILFLSGFSIKAQVAVSTDGSSAHGSAMLEVKSTDKGFLPPRMTETQRDAISNPVAGLSVWCTDCGDNGEMQVYNGNAWTNLLGTEASTAWACGDNLVDSRDGKTYATVAINGQCWMAENLNVGTKINGTSNQTNNATIEKYCYNDTEGDCDTYGGLYQWNEMMQYSTTEGAQGICPEGWHVPTNAEVCSLTSFLDNTVNCSSTGGYMGTNAGGKMKTTGTSMWTSPNSGATNESGFSALPTGYRNTNTSDLWRSQGSLFYLWTSTSYWSWSLANTEARISRYNYNAYFGFSVRCIKDE